MPPLRSGLRSTLNCLLASHRSRNDTGEGWRIGGRGLDDNDEAAAAVGRRVGRGDETNILEARAVESEGREG